MEGRIPFSSDIVGAESKVFSQQSDARWLMVYAASVRASTDPYFDTTRSHGVVAHPGFAACIEWAPLQDLRNAPQAQNVSEDEISRNVHKGIDSHILRPIRANDHLNTVARVISMEQKGDHVHQSSEVITTDQNGCSICVSYQSGVFLHSTLTDDGRSIKRLPSPPTLGALKDNRQQIFIPRGEAHFYSEASRIWNPIHTDQAVAKHAGLNGIILHGTSTFGLALTSIVDACLGGDPSLVERVGCTFSAMVKLPSTVSLRFDDPVGGLVSFEVLNEDGKHAIRDGFLQFRK